MSADDSDDNIIRRREFKISNSIQLEDIIIQNDTIKEAVVSEKKEIDEAIGDIFDPFSQDNENLPGIVRKDGTVEIPPETDVVTNLAKEGERKVNWILMA